MSAQPLHIRGLLALSLLVLAFLALMLPACTQTTPTPPAPTSEPAPTATEAVSPTATPTEPAPTKIAGLTPLPTATPTITPTPIFYTIQSGDTLLSIAKQFSVSVEAVQTANGILDPKRLQVGQELFIPQTEVSDDQAESEPTATPMAYDIAGINFQRSPSGRLWCLGEVQNTAGVDLTGVQVAVSLFDEEGEMVGFGTANTELDVVRNGGSAPFAIAYDDAPATFATYQSVPLQGFAVTHLGSYYLDLEIVEHEGEARGRNSYSVRGRVRNAGDLPATAIRIAVTGFDAEGQVAAVRKVAPAQAELAPGRSSDFEINLLATAGTVVTYTLQAEGLGETP